jgi:small subunit ribosomal protein S7
MARRRRAERRQVKPDPRFGSVELARFINKVMLDGKKTIAQKIVYVALDIAQQESRISGLDVFRQAMRNAMPQVQVRSRRVGGTTYQVPTDIRPERQEALAMKWVITSARDKSGSPMAQRLAQELVEASRSQGNAVRRKEEMHRMAEANRAFAHYRW